MDKLDEKDFLFYRSPVDGEIKVRVALRNNTIWSTQKGMGIIFNTDRSNVTKHLKNIFKTNELDENAVCDKISHTALDGKNYTTTIYSLDVIIALGYRVNSYEATQFRIWATKVLKEYLTKGFVLDDERLKQGNQLFSADYFSELLDRIREIRASERMFYQKITDLYRDSSIDYDKNSKITREFYKKIQNKLIFAVSGKTAPELIKSRASSKKQNMGLQTWKTQKSGGKIIIRDIVISKNYLFENELKELNRLVNMLLDYAENLVERVETFTMAEWVDTLDSFLEFNRYEALQTAGSVAKQFADKIAKREYKKFRIVQDKTFESDFDKIAKEVTTTGKIPDTKVEEAVKEETLYSFNSSLKRALDFNPKEKE